MLHFIKVRSRHICLVCIQLLFTGLGHSQGDYDFTLDTLNCRDGQPYIPLVMHITRIRCTCLGGG